MKKIGLFFGGMSNEADISVKSAKNIVAGFDYEKYELVLIFWGKNGSFYKLDKFEDWQGPKAEDKISIGDFKKYFDVALPMTHGKYGEDGVLQGIFESQKMKYCGCHVLSSALCMDKAVFKNYLSGHRINQTKFKVLDYELSGEPEIKRAIDEAKKSFKLPIYVKPANSGSSIGVTEVNDIKKFGKALEEARKHDDKVIIEEGLTDYQEIEISVLGNKKLLISAPGELKIGGGFYDFDNKYNSKETKIIIPARIDRKLTAEARELAGKVYRLCSCSGFARVDMFVKEGEIYLNEINTLPGFTDVSMFPLLMQKEGLNYKRMINEIIELAY